MIAKDSESIDVCFVMVTVNNQLKEFGKMCLKEKCCKNHVNLHLDLSNFVLVCIFFVQIIMSDRH